MSSPPSLSVVQPTIIFFLPRTFRHSHPLSFADSKRTLRGISQFSFLRRRVSFSLFFLLYQRIFSLSRPMSQWPTNIKTFRKFLPIVIRRVTFRLSLPLHQKKFSLSFPMSWQFWHLEKFHEFSCHSPIFSWFLLGSRQLASASYFSWPS